MIYEKFLILACLVAAVFFWCWVARRNRDSDGKIPIFWGVLAIAIAQAFIVSASAILWPEWWLAHQLIMTISTWVSIAGFVLWGMIEFLRRNY